MSGSLRIVFELREAQMEEIARRAAVLAGLDLRPRPLSPYLTIPEAAAYLRCKRQRVDDLLSQRRLSRVKDGGRTLVLRAELEAYLRGEPTGAGSRAAASASGSPTVPRTASGKLGSGRS
jgi:excisionase family DNA binding protein